MLNWVNVSGFFANHHLIILWWVITYDSLCLSCSRGHVFGDQIKNFWGSTGHFTSIFTQILHPILPGGVMVELFFPEILEGLWTIQVFHGRWMQIYAVFIPKNYPLKMLGDQQTAHDTVPHLAPPWTKPSNQTCTVIFSRYIPVFRHEILFNSMKSPLNHHRIPLNHHYIHLHQIPFNHQ